MNKLSTLILYDAGSGSGVKRSIKHVLPLYSTQLKYNDSYNRSVIIWGVRSDYVHIVLLYWDQDLERDQKCQLCRRNLKLPPITQTLLFQASEYSYQLPAPHRMATKRPFPMISLTLYCYDLLIWLHIPEWPLVSTAVPNSSIYSNREAWSRYMEPIQPPQFTNIHCVCLRGRIWSLYWSRKLFSMLANASFISPSFTKTEWVGLMS